MFTLYNIRDAPAFRFLSVQCNTLHGTEYKITLRRVSVSECVCVCVCARAHGTLGPNISKRAGDRGLVTMGHE